MRISKEPMKIKQEWKIVIFAVLGIGFVAHGYLFLNNFLSSDAIFNLYADQNIITSGRWFLSVACGISSYYQLPWVIGCLSLIWISISVLAFLEIFSVKRTSTRILIAGVFVTFPALVSTFSYLYTADGYMLAICLVSVSILLLQKHKWGFIPAGIMLGFALGIYQAYLAYAIVLCMAILFLSMISGEKTRILWIQVGKMLAYGSIGLLFYWGMLQILLKIQNLTLSTYQGIDRMTKFSLAEIPIRIQAAYADFFTFAVRSKIMANNGWIAISLVFLYIVTVIFVIKQGVFEKIYKKPGRILACLTMLGILPLASNVILLLSSEAFNHLVMRFHWVMFILLPIVIIDQFGELDSLKKENTNSIKKYVFYALIMATSIIIFNNVLRANIAYYNMNERYEKTYAYCLRLANRMEETEGYYTGIPVMMIGVVDSEEYPDLDITNEVTGSMIGVGGSIFLYTGEQYEAFFAHYLNIPLHIIDPDEIIKRYDSEAYKELETFPSMQSMKVIEGILYIKTEPVE